VSPGIVNFCAKHKEYDFDTVEEYVQAAESTVDNTPSLTSNDYPASILCLRASESTVDNTPSLTNNDYPASILCQPVEGTVKEEHFCTDIAVSPSGLRNQDNVCPTEECASSVLLLQSL
jgi:hypothetical protein